MSAEQKVQAAVDRMQERRNTIMAAQRQFAALPPTEQDTLRQGLTQAETEARKVVHRT